MSRMPRLQLFGFNTLAYSGYLMFGYTIGGASTILHCAARNRGGAVRQRRHLESDDDMGWKRCQALLE